MQLDIWSFIMTQLQELVVPALIAWGAFVCGLIITALLVSMVKRRIIWQSLDDPYAKKIAWLIGTIISNVLLIFNILVAFQILGLDVSILMAGISFGIGFAMQQILSNMISGIMIITNPTLQTWRVIQLLGEMNLFATLESLTVRYVIVRTFDRQRMIIPNSVFIKTPYKIYNKEQALKLSIPFRVSLDADFAQIQQHITSQINTLAFVTEHEKTQVVLLHKARSGYNAEVWCYFDSTQSAWFLKAKSLIRQTIISSLQTLHQEAVYERIVYKKEGLTTAHQ